MAVLRAPHASVLPTLPTPLAAGTRLGPYEIRGTIGSGGMGVVYRAHDGRLARDVAIKVVAGHLAANAEARARFEREARAIASLSHPNILSIHDFGSVGDLPYAVTELLEGESLRARLGRQPLPWREAVEMSIAAADGLAAAHARGIVHRDLKPENLFLTTDGRLKVLDFGLARDDHTAANASDDSPTVARTEAGMIVGTFGYLAPEQARGEAASPASDVFALGCVLFEMITGERAFDGDTPADRLTAVLHRRPVSLRTLVRDVPADLDAVVERCLQKDVWRRFPTGRELSAALQALLSDSGRRPASRARRRNVRSVAVLPFEMSATSPEWEFLGDGLAEAIINILSELPKLRVVPRSTVFRYKGQGIDSATIGRELDATDVLTGRVTRHADTLQVQVELVNPSTNAQVWGQHYTRDASDLLALQDALARDITAALQLRLSRNDRRRTARHATPNNDAYQDFLRGRYYLNSYTPTGFAKAIECFDRAISRDSRYAQAYAELANAVGTARFFGYVLPEEADARMRAAVARALELDPQVAEGHCARAKTAFFYQRDWATAGAAFEQALDLKPDYAECRIFYALYQAVMRRPDRALEEGRRALDSSPLFGLVSSGFGMVHMFTGDMHGAIAQARRALDVEPGSFIALKLLAFAYEKLQRYDEALEVLAPVATARGFPPDAMSRVRTALREHGPRGYWEEQLKLVRDLAARRYVPPHDFLYMYANLGDVPRALEHAERCLEINSGILVFIAVDPCLEALRAEPRFQEFMKRVGVPL